MQMYQTMIEEEEVPEPKDSTQIAQLVSEGWMEGGMEGGREGEGKGGGRPLLGFIRKYLGMDPSMHLRCNYYSMCHPSCLSNSLC